MEREASDMAESHQNAVPKTRLIRLKEVQHRVGLGRSTIYRWMAEGEFPQPVPLGGHAVAWVESEVEAWIDLKLASMESN